MTKERINELRNLDRAGILHVVECLDALEASQAELERAKAEAEKAKEERNRCTALERAKYLPKLTEVTRELERVKGQHEAIWNHCNIIYWPKSDPRFGPKYPVEHHARANKNGRDFIEHAMRHDGIPLPEPPKGEGK